MAVVPVGDDRGAGVFGGGAEHEVAGVAQGGERGVAFASADQLELASRGRVALAGDLGEFDAVLRGDERAEGATGVDL